MYLATRLWASNPHEIEKMLFSNPSPSVALLAYVSAVIAAPIAEELLFRGILLASLWKLMPSTPPISSTESGPLSEVAGVEIAPEIAYQDEWTTPAALPDAESRNWTVRAGFLAANIFVSLIFASLHYKQWPAPVALFLLSLGLGFVYRRTGSLVAPIALHATFNGLSTTLMLIQVAAGGASAGAMSPGSHRVFMRNFRRIHLPVENVRMP